MREVRLVFQICLLSLLIGCTRSRVVELDEDTTCEMTYHRNGVLKTMVCKDPFDRLHGLSLEMNEKGDTLFAAEYKFGTLSGDSSAFDPLTKRWRRANHWEGKKYGYASYGTGAVTNQTIEYIDGNIAGNQIQYDEDGKLLRYRYNLPHGGGFEIDYKTGSVQDDPTVDIPIIIAPMGNLVFRREDLVGEEIKFNVPAPPHFYVAPHCKVVASSPEGDSVLANYKFNEGTKHPLDFFLVDYSPNCCPGKKMKWYVDYYLHGEVNGDSIHFVKKLEFE